MSQVLENIEQMTIQEPEKYLVVFVEMYQKQIKEKNSHKMALITSRYFKGKIINGKRLGQNKIYDILPDCYKNIEMKNMVEKRTIPQNQKQEVMNDITKELKSKDISTLKKLLKVFKNYKNDIVNSTIDDMEDFINMDKVY